MGPASPPRPGTEVVTGRLCGWLDGTIPPVPPAEPVSDAKEVKCDLFP